MYPMADAERFIACLTALGRSSLRSRSGSAGKLLLQVVTVALLLAGTSPIVFAQTFPGAVTSNLTAPQTQVIQAAVNEIKETFPADGAQLQALLDSGSIKNLAQTDTDDTEGLVEGQFVPGSIAVRMDLPPVRIIGVLVHELKHMQCGQAAGTGWDHGSADDAPGLSESERAARSVAHGDIHRDSAQALCAISCDTGGGFGCQDIADYFETAFVKYVAGGMPGDAAAARLGVSNPQPGWMAELLSECCCYEGYTVV